MAIQSTSNTGSSIDVASIVGQLMQVEQKPLVAIQEKISKADIKISSLGAFQAKLSEFKANLDKLQDPTQAVKQKVSSSSSAATVKAFGNLSPSMGRYKLSIDQTAEATLVNLNGFASDDQSITNAADYQFKIGNATYKPSGPLSLSELRDWINAKAGLSSAVKASLVQQDANHWVLSIQSLATGTDNAVQVFAPGSSAQVPPYQAAQDAIFSINGVSFTRASNTVNDVIPGLEINLLTSQSETVIEITNDTTTTRPLINDLVSSYNALWATFKSLTQSSATPSLRGVLNGDQTLASIMRQINDTLNQSNLGIGQMGIEFAKDGTLAVNELLYSSLTDLPKQLMAGLQLGGSGAQSLSAFITGILSDSGTLASRIQSEKSSQTDLSKRKSQLEEKLTLLQSRYTAQYAALDALLFKLNNTSTALKGALDALSNSQKNN